MSLLCISQNEHDHPRRIQWDRLQHGTSWASIKLTGHGTPTCLPDAHKDIPRTLTSWAQEGRFDAQAHSLDSQTTSLFWLYGSVSSEKNVIAASTAYELMKAGCLAGSFFCQRDVEDKRDPIQLFRHFSDCLSVVHPGFRRNAIPSVSEYDRISNPTLDSFVDHALITPLSAVGASVAPRSVFVIDALDECNDSGAVAEYLVKVAASACWVKVIVTSCSQSKIQQAFEGSLTTKLELDREDVDPSNRKYSFYMLENEGCIAHLPAHVAAPVKLVRDAYKARDRHGNAVTGSSGPADSGPNSQPGKYYLFMGELHPHLFPLALLFNLLTARFRC